ncbi:MAG: hypothetical protein ACI8S6_001072 [Myxococcota bacterium]|jgi:hypothetical protein
MRWMISLLLSGCAGSCVRGLDSADLVDSAEPAAGERRVVVLVLDGVGIDESFGEDGSELLGVDADALFPRTRAQLMPAGAWMSGALAAGMTRTAPGHCDLLTGRRTAFANYPNDTVTPGAYLPELPTLIDALVPAPSLLVTNSPLVSPVYRSVSAQGGVAATLVYVEGDEVVISELKARLPGSEHRLVVANLHLADALGHNGEFDKFASRVEGYDEVVVDFWLWLQQQPGWQHQTVLAVIADHGRHRDQGEEGWRNHGDHCAGCREIPMLLVGPGVERGVVVEQSVTLEDLGATLAALLDVSMPYATGTPIAEALKAPAGGAAGTIALDQQDGLRVTELLDGGRSVIALGDTIVSSPDAFTAEAPRIASDGTVAFACWRELDLTGTEEAGRWPWLARCVRQEGDTIEQIDPAIEDIWSMWRPALTVADGGLTMAWIDNTTGIAMESSTLWLSRWSPAAGWVDGVPVPVGAFPDGVGLVTGEDGALVVYADSEATADARLGRRITLQRVAGVRGTELLQRSPGAGERLERPAVWSDGGNISVAWIAYRADEEAVGASLWRVDSSDGGAAWGEPVEVDGDVLGHVTPVWTASGALVWVQPEGQLCRDDSGCVSLGSTIVSELVADGEALLVSLRVEQDWVIEER